MTIKLVRSPIGTTQRQKGTLQSLGLKKIGDIRTLNGSCPCIQGMVRKVNHLLQHLSDGKEK